MAYTTPIESSELSDFKQAVTCCMASNIVDVVPLFYCERETVVEAARFSCSTGGGTVALNAAGVSLVAAHTAVTDENTALTVSTTANVVPANTWVTVTGSSTVAKGMAFTFRTTTRIG